MRHRLPYLLSIVLLLRMQFAEAAPDAKAKSSSVMVSYRSGSKMVLGYLYRPQGDGPFPAVIFHHGYKNGLMKRDIGEWENMARLFTGHGYVFFLPDRHTEVVETSEYSAALQQQMKADPENSSIKQQQTIEKTELIGRDITAALAWLKEQPEVDTKRIAVGGHLAGAVQSLHAGDTTEVRALIAFSPALQKWEAEPVIRGLLVSAVRRAKPPVFLIYVENNPTLAPAEALGDELRQKGGLNRSRVFPAFGSAKEEGKTFVPDGVEVWGADVLAFLKEAMR